MKSNSPAFDRLLEAHRNRPWHQKLRDSLRMRWSLFKYDLCGANLFLSLDEEGNEYFVCLRPWLARLLFPLLADEGIQIVQGHRKPKS